MEKNYQVFMNHTVVGTAAAEKCGLYVKFSCRCSIQQEGIYRLSVQDGSCVEDLGTLLRDGGGYYLTTNVPQNRFSTGNFTFEVRAEPRKARGEFVPLASDKPFLYISKLQQSYLEIRDGVVGLVVPKEC